MGAPAGAPKRPGLVAAIWCAFGWHDWAGGRWRRWCVNCGHGSEPAPERPRNPISGQPMGLRDQFESECG